LSDCSEFAEMLLKELRGHFHGIADGTEIQTPSGVILQMPWVPQLRRGETISDRWLSLRSLRQERFGRDVC
ncbi:MAG: hypothetical protein ACK58T_08455, partial [Phycisphaerae bacterium]